MSKETFNWLKVSGNKDELFKFKKTAKSVGQPLLLDNLVPIPKDLKGVNSPNTVNASLQKKYGAKNEGEWCIANWGAGCAAEMVKLYEINENDLNYSFYSIPFPPIEWLKATSKTFPALKFELTYHSMVLCFEGIAIAENGIITKNNCEDTDPDVEYYGVISLNSNQDLRVKFLEKGKSFVLNRRDKGKSHYEILYKVEYIGRTTLLSLPSDLSDILQELKIKNKTFTIFRKTIEDVDCIGFREEKESSTIKDFKAIYKDNMVSNCSGYDDSRNF